MRFGLRFWSNIEIGQRVSLSRRIFIGVRAVKYSWNYGKANGSFNAVYGRLRRTASCELIVYFMSILSTTAFTKIFSRKSIDVVQECQLAFQFRTVREPVCKRKC